MLAITNGRVLTMAGDPLERGTILVDGTKITAVGETIEIPDGTDVFDASGKTVMPGFVESHSHVGIWGDSIGWEGKDFNETSEPITPHMRAIDGSTRVTWPIRTVREAGADLAPDSAPGAPISSVENGPRSSRSAPSWMT